MVEFATPKSDFRLGEWLVQPSLDRISRGDAVLHLRPRLMDLLVFLARNAGRVVTKDEIIDSVWERRFIAESVLSRCVADLRQLLQDDIEKPRFIETIPKRGYRLIARVSWEGEPAKLVPPPPSIVVLPFADMSSGKDQEYFCDGLAEELTNALARLRGMRVVARTSAFAFKGKSVDVREIGRQLSVSAVLEGGIQRAADRLRITVQLINAADGCHLWSDRFDRAAGDVFAIQDEIAQSVAGALRIKLLADDEARLLRRHAQDAEAYDLYLKGRYISARRTADAYAEAIQCFEQALRKDPGNALAYAALAGCYCGSGFLGYLAPHSAFPKAKAAARKALELDPTLAEAHAALGWATWVYDWDWVEAESCFLRAEELSPSCALARFWHAMLLAAMARFDEAYAEIERAWELDPLSLVVQANVGGILLEARQYERAVERFLKTLEMDPDFVLANFHLGRTYYAMGRYEEALAPLEKAAPGFPMALAFVGAAWAKLGRRDKAEEILRELERLSAHRYVGPISFATVHKDLGDTDTALEWYEKAFDAREGVVPLLNVDPTVDCLRSDPRFRALLKRLKAPASDATHAAASRWA